MFLKCIVYFSLLTHLNYLDLFDITLNRQLAKRVFPGPWREYCCDDITVSTNYIKAYQLLMFEFIYIYKLCMWFFFFVSFREFPDSTIQITAECLC